MSSQKIYNDILIQHNLHPLFRGQLEDADFSKTVVNSSCGDELTIMLKIKDGKIVDGRWQGRGCAISQASADIMLDALINQSQDIKALEEVFRMPARLNCAFLPWQALEELDLGYAIPRLN